MIVHRTGRPPTCTYEMGGHLFTVKQLAEMAGCSPQALRRRIDRGCTPAEAVAWGPADRNRPRPEAVGSTRPGKFVLDGKRYTCRELAYMAGCSAISMRSRLRTLDPAEAVARGAADSHRRRKPVEERKTPIKVKAEKKPKPVKPAAKKPGGSEALSAKSWAITAKKKATPASVKVVAPSGPVIVLPGVKVQRAAPIPDRFAVHDAPPLFSGRGIGRYEDTGSAIARQYGGAR